MRKADYTLLAKILAGEIAEGKRRQSLAGNAFRALGAQQQATAMAIAECFAERASVDAAQFLAACGIKPG